MKQSGSVYWKWRLIYPASLILVLWTGSALHFSPQVPGPSFPGIDKLAHFLIYGLFATMLVRVRRLPAPLGWCLVVVIIAGMAGMTEEWIQSHNPYRSFEWADWFADISGAVLAVMLYVRWSGYRQWLEWRVGRIACKKEIR